MNNDASADWAMIRRDPPEMPYQRSGRILTVPADLWLRTFEIVRAYARRRLESCCFWYGIRDEAGNGQACALVVPSQHNSWGNFMVPAQAISDVARATRPLGWRNLAQVHTHPGRGVEHSRYDDAHVNSRQALSLVLPAYGVFDGPWANAIGLHEFQSDYWHLLSPADAAGRIMVMPTGQPVKVVDLR